MIIQEALMLLEEVQIAEVVFQEAQVLLLIEVLQIEHTAQLEILVHQL